MKFRKKPIEVEAWQWDGHSTAPERPEWLRGSNVKANHHEEILKIDTLEGTMTATKGDWIIRGVKGEIYPCKPAVFAAIYETPHDNDALRKAAEEIERLNKRIRELEIDLDFISSQDRPGGDE